MADTLSALARVRRTQGTDLLPDSAIVQLLNGLGIRWRQRLLTPVVMVRLLLLQVLFGNTSISHVRQLSGIDFAESSYCEARMRLSFNYCDVYCAGPWPRRRKSIGGRPCRRSPGGCWGSTAPVSPCPTPRRCASSSACLKAAAANPA